MQSEDFNIPESLQLNDYEYRDMAGSASWGGTRSDNGKNEVVANKPATADNAEYAKQSIGTKIGNTISRFDNSLEGHGDPCNTGVGGDGFLIQLNRSEIFLASGTLLFGYSKKDGWNAGFSLNLGPSVQKSGFTVDVLAISGSLKWDDFKKWGTTSSIGMGPIAYTSSNSFQKIQHLEVNKYFNIKGLSFGPNISFGLKGFNNSISGGYTWLIK